MRLGKDNIFYEVAIPPLLWNNFKNVFIFLLLKNTTTNHINVTSNNIE